MDHGRQDTQCYLPTPQQIRAAAAEIRDGWSDVERRQRAAWSVEQSELVVHRFAEVSEWEEAQ